METGRRKYNGNGHGNGHGSPNVDLAVYLALDSGEVPSRTESHNSIKFYPRAVDDISTYRGIMRRSRLLFNCFVPAVLSSLMNRRCCYSQILLGFEQSPFHGQGYRVSYNG